MAKSLFDPPRYDRTTVLLHWGIALIVVAQWLGAHTIDWFPKGPYRVDARSMHILFGLLLLAALLYRIFWRMTGGVQFPRERGSATALIASGVHLALYALLLAVLVLGVFNTWIRGDDIFGLFHIPQFGSYDAPARHALSNRVVGLHSICSNILLIVAGGHALAGLAHHFIIKDDVLRRMTL